MSIVPLLRPLRARGGGASFVMDNIVNDTLPGNITFTRASAGTYFGADGLLKTAGNNELRFDHHPVTGAPRGLLLEPTRTNLNANNQNFPTGWTANQSPVHNGTKNVGDLVLHDVSLGGNNSSGWYRFIPASNNTRYAVAFITEPISGADTIRIGSDLNRWGTVAGPLQITFNTSTGEVTNPTAAVESTRVESLGSGRFKVTIVGLTNLGVNTTVPLSIYSGTTATRRFYIGGIQLETGTFGTSTILTNGSQVTRATDNLLLADVSTIGFNPFEGTVLVEYDPAGFNTGSAHTLVSFSPGTSQSDVIYLRVQPGSGWIRAIVNVGGTGQGPSGATMNMSTVGAVNKAVMSWKAGELSFGLNGELVTGALGGLPSGITRMRIGGNAANGEVYAGHIRRLTYWPIALPHTQLVNLMQQ